MDHPPEQNYLKKFQSGKGVVKITGQRKRATVFLRNPLFLLVSPVGIEPTTY